MHLDQKDIEKIKKLIFEKRPDLTEDDLFVMIEDKKRELGFPLSDTTALLLVANDLGVKLKPEPRSTKLSKLEPGLSNVTVIGRLIWLGEPREFTTRERKGVVVRGELGDETGTVLVVFWNERVGELETLGVKEGDVLKIEHAYTRASLSGQIELHVGLRSRIEVISDHSAVPPLESFYVKLSDIDLEMSQVNTYGVILDEPLTRTFIRKDGTPSSFMTFRLGFENASCRVVVWGPYVNELRWLRKDLSIVLNGARTRLGRDGLELHLGPSSRIKRSERKFSIKLKTIKLSEVTHAKGIFKTYVRVLAIGEVSKDKEGNPYVSMLVADETAYATLTLLRGAWRQAQSVSVGDVIGLVNPAARVRGNMIFLLVAAPDSVVVAAPQERTIPMISVPTVKIAEITPAHQFVTVEGVVADDPVVITSPAGGVISGNFIVTDETSPCSVMFGPAHAEKVRGLKKRDKVRVEAAQVLVGPEFPLSLRLRSFSKIIPLKSL